MKHTGTTVTIICIFLILSTQSSGLVLPLVPSTLKEPLMFTALNNLTSSEKIETILDMITEDLLRSFFEPLIDCGPRYTGTYGCQQAALFIHDQFTSMDLDVRLHDWSDFGNRYHPRFFTSQNIEGTLPGTSDEIIIFSAHYDTVQNTVGANDDGSGVVAVLASAYILSQFIFDRTLRFVTFSGEEIGLKGSWAYAKEAYHRNDNILFDLNADMIGHATTKKGGSSMRFSITEDASMVLDVFSTINDIANLNFDLGAGAIDREGRGWSDYHPFVVYGYEAVACWQGEGDPNMHTPEDDLSNINYSYLINTTKLITGTLAYLADVQIISPQLQIISPKRQTIYRKDTYIKPINKMTAMVFDRITIKAETQPYTQLTHVEFYYDDILATTDTTPPFQWECNFRSMGTHRIKVIGYNRLGQQTTDFMDIFFINPLINNKRK
ncbi:MAG: M28 family peptidase [Candidatus Thermoplasmatota archaeon]|nr:M28 family peptidase [Candidatus Thermoplasmatota archaeon]